MNAVSSRELSEPTAKRAISDRTSLAALILIWTFLMGTIATCAVAVQLNNDIMVGVIALILLLLLIAVGVPAAVAMAISACIGTFAIADFGILAASLTSIPYDVSASWSLSVLPMFILMGLILWRSGVTATIYVAARQWLGWLPGGLAITTNTAGAMLGAASGSTMAIAYALGRISIPEMLKSRYDSRLATGAVLMAGTVGQLIPPSILAVVYAGIALVPVGPQLLAGVVPGVFLAILYSLQIAIIGVVKPEWAPRPDIGEDRISLGEKLKTLGKVWPVPLIMAVVILGLYLGVFTATEAGAFGAFGAILLAVVYSGRKFPRVVGRALSDTVSSLGSIMFLIISASLLNRMLALSGIPHAVSDALQGSGVGRLQFIAILVVVYLILGMFMEPLSIMLLTVPLLMPSVVAVGIDPIWFGVLVVFMGEIGLVTPPVGLLSYVVYRIAQHRSIKVYEEISLGKVFMGGIMFLPSAFALIVIITVWPEVVTWLPNAGEAGQ